MPITEVLTPLRVRLGARSYDILFGSLESLPEQLTSAGFPPGRCILVTDENVAALYGGDVSSSLRGAGWTPIDITLVPGETTKSLDQLGNVYDQALSGGVDRRTPLITLGGGVVGDLGGFAAATLLRGVPLVQVPTTLIAQVDSAIGGKAGINHATGKNLIGAFYQPKLVLVDPAVLRTLPGREWTSGLAEVVKHGLIADVPLVSFLESQWDAILRRDDDVTAMVVHRAAAIKAQIVEQDEREAGLRAVLNFGHTFAHAIERVAGYGRFTHGEAVAHGMRAALHLSRSLYEDLDFDRAVRLVSKIPAAPGLGELPLEELMNAMHTDKKVERGRLRFVILEEIGRADVTDAVTRSDVEAAWKYAGEHG